MDMRLDNSVRYAARGRKAFTLLEVVLSIALTVVLMSGVFSFYLTVLRSRDAGREAMRDAKLNYAILSQIAREIRQVTPIVPGDGIGFRGDRRWMTVVYTVVPDRQAFEEYDLAVDKPPPAQSDLRRVSYQLLWDEELEDEEGVRICHGLWRTEQRTFDPNPQFIVESDDEDTTFEEDEEADRPEAKGELIAPEIKYVEFEYFDGAEWRDRWQFAAEQAEDDLEGGDIGSTGDPGTSGKVEDENTYALPQAVRITIGRERVSPEEDEMEFDQFDEEDELEEYYPDRFTIVVPLLQADQTLLSSRKYGVSDSIAREAGGAR